MTLPSVLIVDDDPAVLKLVETILASRYRCRTASGAAAAREQLSKEAFDLVLSDIQMPVESGFSLIKFIRASYPETAVVVISAIDDPTEAQQALNAGIAGYIIKPIESHQLLITTASALRTVELGRLQCTYQESLEAAVRERTEALKAGEIRFRQLVEGSIQGILIHVDYRPVFVNSAFAEIHGYTRQEILAIDRVTELIAPEDHERLKSYADARFSGQPAPDHYEYRGLRRDGTRVWLESRVIVVEWEGATAIQLTVSDISRRKAGEAAIRESEARLKGVLDAVLTGVVLIEERTKKIVEANLHAIELIGLPREAVIGQVCQKFICSADIGRCPISDLGQTVDRQERVLVRGDGDSVPVLKTVTRIHLGGEPYLIDSFVDISETKEAQAELARAHGELAAIMSGISSILIGIASDSTITHWNANAEKVLGLSADAALGRPLNACAVPWDLQRVDEGVTACLKNHRPLSLEDLRFTRADGKDGFLGLRISPIAGASAKSTGVLVMGADITRKKLLENQFAQAQKLESIGQLAAGIAHEINTPIQYVGDNTRFLQDAFDDIRKILAAYDRLYRALAEGAPTAAAIRGVAESVEAADLDFLTSEIPLSIEQTLEGVARVSRIVRSMKEFSHPGADEKSAVDINRALESTITVARNEWKYVADLETDFDEHLPPVQCLAGEMNQVFLNLIINAAHAIADVVEDGSDGKGAISVSTRGFDGMVEIAIGDTGAGISETIQHRVFDPFFTTKGVGKGTGQGLAIAHTTVTEKHGGRIFFTSESGAGTTFFIQLPLEANDD